MGEDSPSLLLLHCPLGQPRCQAGPPLSSVCLAGCEPHPPCAVRGGVLWGASLTAFPPLLSPTLGVGVGQLALLELVGVPPACLLGWPAATWDVAFKEAFV